MSSDRSTHPHQAPHAGGTELSSWWPTVFVAVISSALLFWPGLSLSFSVGEAIYYTFTSSNDAGLAPAHAGEALIGVWMFGFMVCVVLALAIIAALLAAPKAPLGRLISTSIVVSVLAAQLLFYLARPVLLAMDGAYQG